MSTEERSPSSPTQPGWARSSDLPIWVLVLAAMLIALIGFGAGSLASDRGGGHRHRAFTSEGRAERGASAGVPGPVMGHGIGPGPGTPYGAVVAGAVTGVEGDSFAIRTFRGDTIAVHTSEATVVRLASAHALSALEPGQIVFVSGIRDADGSIEASRVLGGVSPPSAVGSG